MINGLNVYVAGPMESVGGNMNEPLFDYVTKQLRASGCTVMNPAELTRELIGPISKLLAMSKAERKETRKGLLAKELKWIIDNADRVVLLPGWEKSPGATAERATALAMGIPVHELPDEVSLMQENVAIDIDEPTAA
jgi:Domain of unknown function (DUF4406)